MELKISIKDLITYILIAALIFFGVVLYFRQEAIVQANQVRANTSSIQAIVTFLNSQGQQPQTQMPVKKQAPVKK